MSLQIVFCEQNKRFFILAHIFRFFSILTFQTAMLCPFQSEINAPTRMEIREKKLKCLTAKHATQEFKFPVAITKSVTMSQKELLAIDFASQRLTMDGYSAFFLQIVATPYIMIAYKEMNLNT